MNRQLLQCGSYMVVSKYVAMLVSNFATVLQNMSDDRCQMILVSYCSTAMKHLVRIASGLLLQLGTSVSCAKTPEPIEMPLLDQGPVGVLLKRLNTGSHKQNHTIAQGLYFSDAKS